MPESAQKVIHELTAAGLLSSAEITKFDNEIKVGAKALLDRLVADEKITRYQADKFHAGQSSDIYFGDYIVLEELGRGGMGTVLLARHRRMDREVAIKILPVTALDSEASVARFYQEVKVAAQLTHPNIVHSYDAGEHLGFHYLVMEYVRGHDLSRVLEQLGPIPVTLALDYITQVSQGLEYAHRKGIIHRDIKPSNLLLDNEGAVKILDMGLARLGKGIGSAEASMHLTTTGQVMGTVEYMSPEQAEDTRVADERSDIYSLGCTLYRLVTGEAPFGRDTVVKTILAHREAAIPSFVRDKNPELAKLDPLFRRLVAKNPDDRIQNATMLVQELRRLVELADFSSSEVVLDSEVEIVSRGSSPSEFPTIQHQSTDRQEIAYISDVVASGSTAKEHPPQTPVSQVDPSVSGTTNPSLGSSAPNVAAGMSNPYVAPATPVSGTMHAMPTGSSPMTIGGKRHRGGLILGLGIVSLLFTFPCFIGVILAVINWVFASNDISEMRAGTRDPAGLTMTQSGRVLSMISCGIGAIWTIVWLFG